MTDLLKEFITDILSLGEAGKKPTPVVKPSNAKFTVGGKWYTSDPEKDGVYVGRVAGSKWVPATPAEKASELNKSKKDQVKPTRGQPPADTQQQPQVKPEQNTSQVVLKALQIRLNRVKDSATREQLTALSDALSSGNKKEIQKVVTDLKLVISPEKKLKAMVNSGDARKIVGDSTDFARSIYDLAKAAGVEIPGSSQQEPKESSEEFKPQSIFKKESLAQLDVKEVEGGIEIEGQRFEEITDEKKIKEIEDTLVEQARQKLSLQDRELDSAYEDRIRKYVRARVEANNHNIRYVREQTRGGKPLPAYEFRGQEGSKLITQRMSGVLNTHIRDEKKRMEAQDGLSAMAAARTPREFNEAYERFSKAVQGTAIQKNIKYIAETITALRVTALGGTALIPRSESFPLADVISVKKNPITGEADIDQILVDVDEEQEISVAGSVKAGKGAGSGNLPKIQNSRFNTDTVDGVDCSRVVEDMTAMASIERRNAIFQPTEDGDITSEEKQRILGELERYGSVIKAYYGITEDLASEQLYEFLSYGKQMVCLDGKPSPTADGTSGQPFAQAQKRNGKQWRAWSVVGLMTEAIHNRTVEIQYYHTLRYNGVIKSADGIRRFSKMQFQPFKKEAGKEGNTRPDQAQNAFTIPASPEETRNNNPCTQ
jgi:hypothetical protein